MDGEGLNEAVVDAFLDGRLTRVPEHGGLRVNDQVDGSVDEIPGNVPGGHLDKAGGAVVELGFYLAFEEGLAILGLVDPLSIVVAQSQANVNDVSVELFLALNNINKPHRDFEVPLL